MGDSRGWRPQRGAGAEDFLICGVGAVGAVGSGTALQDAHSRGRTPRSVSSGPISTGNTLTSIEWLLEVN